MNKHLEHYIYTNIFCQTYEKIRTMTEFHLVSPILTHKSVFELFFCDSELLLHMRQVNNMM
jgi:hypothetical protein